MHVYKFKFIFIPSLAADIAKGLHTRRAEQIPFRSSTHGVSFSDGGKMFVPKLSSSSSSSSSLFHPLSPKFSQCTEISTTRTLWRCWVCVWTMTLSTSSWSSCQEGTYSSSSEKQRWIMWASITPILTTAYIVSCPKAGFVSIWPSSHLCLVYYIFFSIHALSQTAHISTNFPHIIYSAPATWLPYLPVSGQLFTP